VYAGRTRPYGAGGLGAGSAAAGVRVLLYAFSVSAAVTIAALPVAALVLRVLLRSGAGALLVAAPTRERWHDRPTPTFGGVGIAAGLLAGVGLALAVGAVELTGELVGILAGVAIVFAAGLVDDVRGLSPLGKVAAQLAAAGVAVAAGLRVELVGNEALAVLIAILWLVGITNAFNLLDNMDGLAATLAAIACGYFAIDAATEHPNDLVLVLSLAVGCACLGFLPFNLRPGRPAAVFMGDSGSQALGFSLAGLGLAASWTTAGTTVATILLPLLVLAVPILDTTLVTVLRLLERRPVTRGGKDHASHRLVYYGLSEATAVGLLALIAIVLGATAVAYNVLDDVRLTVVGVLLTVVLLVQFGGFLSDLSERTRAGRTGEATLRRALTFEPRRLVEVLADFALVSASFLLAYLLLVGGKGSDYQRGVFLDAFPVVLGLRYVAFVGARIYRRVWRYATPPDLLAIAAACVVSAAGAWAVVEAIRDLGDFPARVFFLDALLCSALVASSRLVLRLAPELAALARRGKRRRVLIVGAGRSGRSLARELREDPGERVVGFVDDNPAARGRRYQGVTVLGGTGEAERILERSRPDLVLVTIPNASPERIDTVVRACGRAGVPCRVVRRETETAVPLVEVTAE
jgi:UDP-GlcNAc:undecaprenyl-phosphate GlcNAc-1-phosphate transferase